MWHATTRVLKGFRTERLKANCIGMHIQARPICGQQGDVGLDLPIHKRSRFFGVRADTGGAFQRQSSRVSILRKYLLFVGNAGKAIGLPFIQVTRYELVSESIILLLTNFVNRATFLPDGMCLKQK